MCGVVFGVTHSFGIGELIAVFFHQVRWAFVPKALFEVLVDNFGIEEVDLVKLFWGFYNSSSEDFCSTIW